MIEKVKKKLLDREVPWEKIPPQHAHLYEEAEVAEWNEWNKRGSVRVCPLDESKKVNATVQLSLLVSLVCVLCIEARMLQFEHPRLLFL